MPPPVDFPPYVGPGSRSFRIGGNAYLIEGQSFTISCPLADTGNPPAGLKWFKDGVELTMEVNRTTITIPTGPSNDSSMVEGAGAYTCTAENVAGTDSAVSNMRAGIGWFAAHVNVTYCKHSIFYLHVYNLHVVEASLL